MNFLGVKHRTRSCSEPFRRVRVLSAGVVDWPLTRTKNHTIQYGMVTNSRWSKIVRYFALRYRRWARARIVGDVESIVRAAGATMRRKKLCLLATPGDHGVDARVLMPFPPDDQFGVWMGTAATSRKISQLRADGRATLVYEDDRKSACVVLVGEARVVDDLDERRKRFMPLWWVFWPDGPDSDFALIHFVPHRIEVLDTSRRITPEPFGLRAAAIERAPSGAWVLS